MNWPKEGSQVAVVILNRNGRQWLRQCLDTVLAQESENTYVYLVDNGSTDGSQELVQKEYPAVRLIQNRKNLGAAEGYNVGMRLALKEGADYIALLNEDTRVDPDWLGPLIEAAKADSAIGVLSPMHWDYEGRDLDPLFLKLLMEETSYLNDLERDQLPKLYQTERVIGAAMIISGLVCQRVGLFDPLYFIHHEETDFCRRARYHGFRVAVVTASRIYHYNRRAHHPGNQKAPYINVRNIPLYNWKHPWWSFWKKLKAYLGFGINFAKITGWPVDLRHLIKIAYIQLWILLLIPNILWRTRKERKGACYIDG